MATKEGEYTRTTPEGFLEMRVRLGHGVPSRRTGRSLVLATSQGFQPVEGSDGVAINFNVIRKREK